MAYYVCDTHALVWYLTGSSSLSQRAKDIMLRAERGNEQIFVPTIVLAELLTIAEKKRASVDVNSVLDVLGRAVGFLVTSFDYRVFIEMISLDGDLELHDRVVAATSQILNAPVITMDPKISGKVPVVW